MAGREEILLADADVLIDYNKVDLSILRLVARHTGPVHVPRQVLDTVDGLTEARCRRYGITVIETETDMLLRAGQQSGSLSFEDWICYLLCEQNRWVCVTNDHTLIKVCKRGGLAYRRGLRLMIDLVAQQKLTRAKALRTARRIHKTNPHHINEQVLKQFVNALDGTE